MAKSKKEVTEAETTDTTATSGASLLVEAGSVIQVHYKGTFPDGETFDSSYDRDLPITVTVGSGQLLPGFDNALVGMTVGQTKHIELAEAEAYGPRNPNAYAAVPLGNFPEEFAKQLEEGATIPLTDSQGNNVLGTVETINEESVIFDMNHPMAGKDLEFDIEVVGFTASDSDLL
jgi:FKBP-type peptidyl-prolyl cis-trans isomerase 2